MINDKNITILLTWKNSKLSRTIINLLKNHLCQIRPNSVWRFTGDENNMSPKTYIVYNCNTASCQIKLHFYSWSLKQSLFKVFFHCYLCLSKYTLNTEAFLWIILNLHFIWQWWIKPFTKVFLQLLLTKKRN